MLQLLSSGHLVWEASSGVCGSLNPTVLRELKSWSQKTFVAKEAGGLLLGFIDKDTGGLLAETLTIPGPGDKRTRRSFYRCSRHQQEAVQWHEATHHRGTQLGLWHTHPEPFPSPSVVDIDDCAQVLSTGTFDCPGIMYVIVGTKAIGCWYAVKGAPFETLGFSKL